MMSGCRSWFAECQRLQPNQYGGSIYYLNGYILAFGNRQHCPVAMAGEEMRRDLEDQLPRVLPWSLAPTIYAWLRHSAAPWFVEQYRLHVG
jgi:hypothetical protein